MSREAQIQIRDLIVEMMANGVRTGVLTEAEATAACAAACAQLIATMIPPENHAEALEVTIEKLSKQVEVHAAEVAALRRARAN